jgi:hypothetical protein
MEKTKSDSPTYNELSTKFEAARASFKEEQSLQSTNAANLRKLQREIKQAVAVEDYATAARLKAETQQLDPASRNLVLRRLAEEVSSLYSAMSTQFREEFPAYFAPRTIEVTSVVVVNPKDGSQDQAQYFDAGDSIQLRVGSASFDSEAHHVGSWAVENGLLAYEETVSVKLPI